MAKMVVKAEIVPLDEFEEVGEFDMPLEKDYILNTNIDREIEILNKHAKENGYKPLSIT